MWGIGSSLSRSGPMIFSTIPRLRFLGFKSLALFRPQVVPRSGSQMTPDKLTNMLRCGGHLSAVQSVKTLRAVPLALQGVLSQTFKIEVRAVLQCVPGSDRNKIESARCQHRALASCAAPLSYRNHYTNVHTGGLRR